MVRMGVSPAAQVVIGQRNADGKDFTSLGTVAEVHLHTVTNTVWLTDLPRLPKNKNEKA
jgi:hypothetical protein